MPARASSRVLLALFIGGLVLLATGFLVPGASVGVALVVLGAAALVVVAVAVLAMAVWSGASPGTPVADMTRRAPREGTGARRRDRDGDGGHWHPR